MTWYYASGGQQQGPVDEAQFEALIQSGQIQPTDLVWREGMANWQPLNSVRPASPASPAPIPDPLAGPASPPAAAPVAASGASGSGSDAAQPGTGVPPAASSAGSADVGCVECGGRFARDQAIQYGSTWVCASCKPVFLQKLKEGMAGGGAGTGGANRFPLGPTDPNQLETFIRSRDYRVDVGSCLSRAWQLVTANFWPSVGATALVMLFVIGMQMLSALCCFLVIFPILFQGPLLGGLFCYFVRLKREGSASISDVFYPFANGWPQLMLFMVVSSGVMLLLSLPGGGLVFAMDEGLIPRSLPVMIAVNAVAFVPIVYLSVSWAFTNSLILDRQLDFWRSMELSRRVIGMHWWRMLWFFIVAMFGINILGVLAICLGLLISLPVSTAAMAILYDDIFNETAAPAPV